MKAIQCYNSYWRVNNGDCLFKSWRKLKTVLFRVRKDKSKGLKAYWKITK